MDNTLLDTSWSLHYISTNSQTYRSLFTSPPSQPQLQKYTTRFTQYLATHTPQYLDDLNDERDKLGILKECKWNSITLKSFSSSSSSTLTTTITTKPAISITLIYQTQTFKFILYSASLVLIKSPPTHTTRFLDFLNTTFNISTDPLKLPSSLLSDGLSSYITFIYAKSLSSSSSNNTPSSPPTSSPPTHLLKTTLSTLKLTITITSPNITPNLRSIDLDIPYETIENLISISSPPPPSSSSSTLEPNTPGSTFLTNLQKYITNQTGIKLPLLSSSSSSSSLSSAVSQSTNYSPPLPPPQQQSQLSTATSTATEPHQTQQPMKLSRISCSAFAISVDGRVKFSSKPVYENGYGDGDGDGVNNGEEDEDGMGIIGGANGLVLGIVEGEAMRRGGGG